MKLSCGCKNIQIDWDVKPQDFIARSCGCDYCGENAAEYVSDSSSSFSFKVKNPSDHLVIQHGHKTADFHECKNCGAAFVSCEIDGDLYGVINAKVMGLNDYAIDSVLKDYSTETISMRLERRKKNWCKLY
ncbi:MAG: hypothetical protein P8H31_02730 [Porticoccaceae bacterium]|nr:hypothetical protein [Porticoccaceae bacterium]